MTGAVAGDRGAVRAARGRAGPGRDGCPGSVRSSSMAAGSGRYRRATVRSLTERRPHSLAGQVFLLQLTVGLLLVLGTLAALLLTSRNDAEAEARSRSVA